jgi:prolyl-tRNA synthetase
VIARRDTGEKKVVALADVVQTVHDELTQMQTALYERALAFRNESTRRVDTWEEFEKAFEGEGGAGLIVAHWDGTDETENEIAERTKATIRCIPLTALDPSDEQPGTCVLTGKPSARRVVFAKAY